MWQYSLHPKILRGLCSWTMSLVGFNQTVILLLGAAYSLMVLITTLGSTLQTNLLIANCQVAINTIL